MNAERIRHRYRYSLRTSRDLKQGAVWIFLSGKPHCRHYLVYDAAKRQFRAGRKYTNGYGTERHVRLPRKIAELLRSMLPDEEIARAISLSIEFRNC